MKRSEKNRPWFTAARAVLLCVVLLAPVSCAGRIEQIPPPLDVPGSFSATGNAKIPAKWWTVFDDEELNSLVDEALAGNFDLKAAWDRLDQAQAVARKAGADLLPGLSGDGGASRTRTKVRRMEATYGKNFSLGLLASYELDLWGRVRSSARSAGMELLATREDLDAAAITLSAEVALNWYKLVDARARIAVLDRQIKTNRDYVGFLEDRFRQGQASSVDVLQQKQLLEATKADKIRAESLSKVLEHRLAILLGKAPGNALPARANSLPLLPPLPAVGLPAELIRRRPDVRSAHLRVHSADSNISAAIAERFPKISLSIGADTAASDWRDLFDNWIATLAANLTAPIFDGGRRAEEVRRTRAVASERLHNYGRAVLNSLGEVEDALSQEAGQDEQVKNLALRFDLSKKSVQGIRTRYLNGAVNYLRVLDAQRTHQILELSLLSAKLERLEYRISLYRALAGGWDLNRATDEERKRSDDGEQKDGK